MEVSGLVKDAKTKTPLPGATVGLYVGADELAVIPSDDNGEFTFSVGAEYIGKILTCQVEKQGYETQKIEHKVTEEKVDLGIIELVPVREIAFSLRIKDETGNPLSGVNVSLDLDTGQVGSGRSDENGLFRMTLRPDLVGKTLKYTAKRLLYKTETGQIQIEKKENSAEITMKRIVFPLWAKITAGIAAAVIVVAIVIAWIILNGQVKVPNVIGQTESQATATIAEAGLSKGQVTSRDDSAMPGTVIAQEPAGGVQVSKGTSIALVLSERLPDLIIESLTHAPANPTTSDTITFTAVVKNVGSGEAGPSILALKVGGQTNPKTFSVPALRPGQEKAVGRTEVLRTAQRYRNTATADFSNQVRESNENNNQKMDDYQVQGSAPAVFSHGTVEIRGTWSCDLDQGKETQTDADFFWQQKTEIIRSITPRNGAKFFVLERKDFNSIDYNDLTRLGYSSTEINGSNNASNQIPQGTVIAAITSKGRYCKFKIDTYGYNLRISWVTYTKSE